MFKDYRALAECRTKLLCDLVQEEFSPVDVYHGAKRLDPG